MSAFHPNYEGQSATNRHQLQTGSRSVGQPVTNCHQLADLFQRDKSVISHHIKNVFEEGELLRGSVVANFATTAAGGKTCQGQLVSNCNQRNSRAFCLGQSVTNCNRLNVPAANRKQRLTGVANANGVGISQPSNRVDFVNVVMVFLTSWLLQLLFPRGEL